MPAPTGPNPMMAALQASRQQNPVSSSGPMPGGPMPAAPSGPSPEIQKMASDIQDIKAAVDKLIEAISGAYTGKTPGSPDVEESDDDKEGSADTFTNKKD